MSPLWGEDIKIDYVRCILLRKDCSKQAYPFSNSSVLTRDTWHARWTLVTVERRHWKIGAEKQRCVSYDGEAKESS